MGLVPAEGSSGQSAVGLSRIKVIYSYSHNAWNVLCFTSVGDSRGEMLRVKTRCCRLSSTLTAPHKDSFNKGHNDVLAANFDLMMLCISYVGG